MGKGAEQMRATEEEDVRDETAVVIGDKRLQGICKGCGAGIPFGYLVHVSKWSTIQVAPGVKRQLPKEMFCKGCAGHGVSDTKMAKTSKKTTEPTPAVSSNGDKPETSLIQETAKKLYKEMSKDKPHSIRWLAKKAKVADVDKAVLKTIFRKLEKGGKIELIEGQWRKI